MRPVRNTLLALGVASGVLAAVAASPAGASGPIETPGPVHRARVLMGTVCEARAFGDEAAVGPALDAALDRIAAIEDALTTWRPDGGLARLNAACAAGDPGAAHPVDDDLARALADALAWARITDGAFDPTVGALVDAWGLREGGRVPDDGEIDAALARTSWRAPRVDTRRSTVRCGRRGLAFDLGGFGKGWALDEAAEVLRARGVEAALVNFGGQVLALGAPPGADGWIVDVADPADRQAAATSLTVRDASVATSGNAERPGHLLDPRSGRTVRRAASATVVHPNAAAADALATAALVAGPAAARRALPRDARLIWLDDTAATTAAATAAGTTGPQETPR